MGTFDWPRKWEVGAPEIPTRNYGSVVAFMCVHFPNTIFQAFEVPSSNSMLMTCFLWIFLVRLAVSVGGIARSLCSVNRSDASQSRPSVNPYMQKSADRARA